MKLATSIANSDNVSMTSGKGNFSNTRIALVDFRRRISAFQHSVMVYQLCRAV